MRGRAKVTKEDKEWALKVKERDENVCIICKDPIRLNAHHLIPREIADVRFDVNNGISLCPSHHRFNTILSAHKNPVAFIKWLIENRPDTADWLFRRC